MNEAVKGDFFSPVADEAKEKRYADWKGMNRFFAELKRRHVTGSLLLTESSRGS